MIPYGGNVGMSQKSVSLAPLQTTAAGAAEKRDPQYRAMMDCSTCDALLESEGPFRIRNRETGETIELSRDDYDDLVRVHLCDWLEQVARSGRWTYRRDAFRRMARRLGGVAQESYERVYA